MARNISLRSTLILALLIFALAAPAAFAQKDKKNNADAQDVMERPRKKKEEVKKIYREWPDKDVAYIITDAERSAFKKLATDEEREQFIEGFWQRRDPDPDTDENEYKEEYYERIAYANEHYASGIPGWKTDRGRIYITFGKPDSVESHPSGGAYDRPSYHGGGSTTTYPFEVWFYRYLEGVGSGIEIEFVDPTGTGEYRLARSPDEKDALAMVPGAGLTLNESLGLSSKADRVAYGSSYQRQQDSPFARLQLLADLSRPPVIKNAELASLLTGSGTIEDNPLNFDMRIDFYRQSDERVVTAFTIQTDNKELTFTDVGGVQTARMNIFGRITSVAGRRVGVFEDAVTATASSAELLDMKNRKSAYGKTVPLAPGTYRVDVIVRDINSGATQVKHLGFTVPKYDPKQLSTSTLVLAVKLQNMSDAPAVGQFTIGQFKVIPNVARTYRRGEPVGLYLQVYNAGIDQTTLRPSVDVDYVILKDGKELGRIAEDWRGMSDAGQRLTLARMLTTDQLAPGEYELMVRIKDRVSGQSLSPSEKFTLVQ
ncbi:MAG TPA: GWxTD domain-containing protein [Pyrinomonadaceae bacterium]|nr:GWxTD domain-containing protein [Pyrinomonadaceae bacterium]